VAGHLTLRQLEDTSIVILAFVALGLGVVIAVSGLVYARRLSDGVSASREVETPPPRGAGARAGACFDRARRARGGPPASLETEAEVRERRGEMARLEQRLASARRAGEAQPRCRAGGAAAHRREEELEQTRVQIEEERTGVAKELERVAA